MPDYGRDTDIGSPDEKTLDDVYNELGEVKDKVEDVEIKLDESVTTQKLGNLASELILGEDIDGIEEG